MHMHMHMHMHMCVCMCMCMCMHVWIVLAPAFLHMHMHMHMNMHSCAQVPYLIRYHPRYHPVPALPLPYLTLQPTDVWEREIFRSQQEMCDTQ